MVGFLLIVALIFVGLYLGGFFEVVSMEKHPPKDLLDENKVVGMAATVISEFGEPGHRASRSGRVQVAGESWNAETLNNSLPFRVGDEVSVVARKGLTLIIDKPA